MDDLSRMAYSIEPHDISATTTRPLGINPYERSRRPSRRKPDGPIVGKVVAGVPTRRTPRTSLTIEHWERERSC